MGLITSFRKRIHRDRNGIRLILVPKQDPLGEEVRAAGPPPTQAAASAEAKATANRFEDAVDPALKEFEKIGLSAARSDPRNRASPAESAGEFDSLSLVRAVAVRLKDESKLDALLDATERDFHPILDVRTESDPARPGIVRRRRKGQGFWPDWTNLAPPAQEGVRGAGVLMGVLDTGVDADHAEFKRKPIEFRYIPPAAVERSDSMRNVRGFDTDGHGTHVCGIIAGKQRGIARDANLHVAAVIESETLRTSLWRTLYGLDWMFRSFSTHWTVNVPCVVNLSLCFFEDLMDAQEIRDWKLALSRPIEDLHRKDALIVAAAGNRGEGLLGFPAGFNNVLAVGAVDRELRVASFSGKPTGSARRDIYGLGVDIDSAFERDREGRSSYRPLNGTSMAAPYVAGVAALLRATNPAARASEVRDHLLETAVKGEHGVPVARFEYWKRKT